MFKYTMGYIRYFLYNVALVCCMLTYKSKYLYIFTVITIHNIEYDQNYSLFVMIFM